LMTSIATSVFFFMIILCHCINSLLMKHANTLKSNNDLVSIIMDLSYFIMIGNKKNKVLGLKVNWDHFEHMMCLNPVSKSLLRLDILISWILKRWHVNGSGLNYIQ
jgi:hypothetical protein